jgi:hypothetical protein
MTVVVWARTKSGCMAIADTYITAANGSFRNYGDKLLVLPQSDTVVGGFGCRSLLLMWFAYLQECVSCPDVDACARIGAEVLSNIAMHLMKRYKLPPTAMGGVGCFGRSSRRRGYTLVEMRSDCQFRPRTTSNPWCWPRLGLTLPVMSCIGGASIKRLWASRMRALHGLRKSEAEFTVVSVNDKGTRTMRGKIRMPRAT